jgi:hypothetical protein
MLKTITAIVATASIAAAALVTPKPAEASCLGCRFSGGVGGAFASPFPSPFASRAYGYGFPAYGYAPYAYAPDAQRSYVRHYVRHYVRRYY